MSVSPEVQDYQAFQAKFAARIRDPRGQPRLHGVPVRRMRVYEDLLFNNLEGFLLACFPITRKLLGVRAWRKTVRRFFIEHRCASPLFRDIPCEFLEWMEPLASDLFPARPYLYEFMHYEWLELAVSVSPEEAIPDGVCPNRDLLSVRPIINPTAQLACYRYPVHCIGPRFNHNGQEVSANWYLLYRDAGDAVRFVVLTQISVRLLELIRDAEMSGHAAMLQIAEELNHQDSDQIIGMGLALLNNLRHAGVVY